MGHLDHRRQHDRIARSLTLDQLETRLLLESSHIPMPMVPPTDIFFRNRVNDSVLTLQTRI